MILIACKGFGQLKPTVKRKPKAPRMLRDVVSDALAEVCHVTGLKPEKDVLAALLRRQAKKGLK